MGVKMADLNRRDAIFGYRLRFSPETQPIRQTVLDSIVLQNIREFDGDPGATVGKLRDLSIGPGQTIAITLDEARASLARLECNSQIRSVTIKRKRHWHLTEVARNGIDDKEAHTARMRGIVAEVLFGPGSDHSDRTDVFFSTLGIIFDEITVTFLDAMFSDKPTPLAQSTVAMALETAANGRTVDKEALTAAIQRFFSERTPDFDWIKWTYCKNYYSVRALGLGASADVLSGALFSGSSFFLDTNVIICALDPTSERHLSAKQVLNGLGRIGCDIKVLEITLAELEDLATRLQENLGNTLRQIPDGLLDKVAGLVARAEARHRQDETAPTPEEMLDQFKSAEDLVENRLDAFVVRDSWFDQQQENSEIGSLSKSLRQHYDNSSYGRRKTEAAARHDALALTFISNLCKQDENHAFFVTLDRSLPQYKPASLFDGLRVNRAITLEGLMSWLGTISNDDDNASVALSEVLAAAFLPSSGSFELHEFRMLAELGMDCRHMPADDVENCLRFLRREARDVNLAMAEDRERLHALVKGFFASPDRTYLAEMNTLRSELEEAQSAAASERSARRETEKRELQLRVDLHQKELNIGVAKRFLATLAIWLGLLGGSTLLAVKYGAGDNLLQQVGNTWWLFGTATAICLVLARLLCRGELWETAKQTLRTLGN